MQATAVAQGEIMKYWRLEGPKTLEMHEDEPTQLTPQKNVKVKIEQILYSTSDYEIYTNGTGAPIIPGKNAVGVVSEVFDKERTILTKMDRVAIEPFVPCGKCDECHNKNYSHCEQMQELGQTSDGLLQNFVDLPSSTLHKLPDVLSNEKALYLSYVALGLNITDALNFERGEHVAVFANTKAGIILCQLLSYYKAVPIFITQNTGLLEIASQTGIFYAFNEENFLDKVKTVTGGRMCKQVVFFSNSNFDIDQAYSIASFNAEVCIAGYGEKDTSLSIKKIAQKHLKVFGVFNGYGNFPSAINLMVTNTVNVDGFIGDKLKFDNLSEELQSVKGEDLTVKGKIIVVD